MTRAFWFLLFIGILLVCFLGGLFIAYPGLQ